MKQPTVIMICGYARTGKDTLADGICDAIPGARKVSFATALKNAANLFLERLDLHREVDFHDDAHKSRHRDFLVAGGKLARSIDQDVFAKIGAAEAYVNLLAGRVVVVNDWRYINELHVMEAKVSPHRIVTVRLDRAFQTAANADEDVNMMVIEDLVDFDYSWSFASGDLRGIRDVASIIADSIPDQPGA